MAMTDGWLAGETDAWGRPIPPPLPKLPRVPARRAWERWALVFLRGLVFVPGALLGLLIFVGLGYGGFNVIVVFAHLLWVPAAIVCWVQASVGKGGDRWTLGFIALWVLELGMMRIGSWIF